MCHARPAKQRQGGRQGSCAVAVGSCSPQPGYLLHLFKCHKTAAAAACTTRSCLRHPGGGMPTKAAAPTPPLLPLHRRWRASPLAGRRPRWGACAPAWSLNGSAPPSCRSLASPAASLGAYRSSCDRCARHDCVLASGRNGCTGEKAPSGPLHRSPRWRRRRQADRCALLILRLFLHASSAQRP